MRSEVRSTAKLSEIVSDSEYFYLLGQQYNIRGSRYGLSTEDLPNLGASKLLLIFEGQFLHKSNVAKWEKKVADPKLIIKDLDHADDELLWAKKYAPMLAIRATPGRASNGHGQFFEEIRKGIKIGIPSPNTTIEDVVSQTEHSKLPSFSIEEFRAHTDEVIAEIMYPFEQYFTYLESRLKDSSKSVPTKIQLKNKHGKPILGLSFLSGKQLDPVELLRGFYFGSKMDDFANQRKKVQSKYNIQLGGGEAYAMDIDRLKHYNIGFDDLSHASFDHHRLLKYLPYKQRIALFKKAGIIQPLAEPTATNFYDLISQSQKATDNLLSVYVREERGRGVADDIAVMLSAFLPSIDPKRNHGNHTTDWFSRMTGTYLADFIDTLDKSSSRIVKGGIDGALGDIFNQKFKEFSQSGRFRDAFGIPEIGMDLVRDQEIYDWIAASWNPETPIHSSARWFLKTHRDNDESIPTCALREQYMLVQSMLSTKGELYAPLLERHPRGKFVEREPSSLRVGFAATPWNYVKSKVHERAAALTNPNRQKFISALYS